jgi:hypothetical protein
LEQKSVEPDPAEFRPDAVRQRQTGDQVDRPLVLVGIKGWLSLAAVALLLGAAICWMLAASIPVRVNGHGILLPSDGMSTMDAPCDGVISAVLVREGDIIEPGDCLARIGNAADGTAPRSLLCATRARVEAVQVLPGDSVQTGDILFTLEPETGTDPGLQAVLYFAPDDAQGIRTGMTANLDPAGTDFEDCGYLLGHVTSVSAFPVTCADIAGRIDDEDLAREWTAGGPLIQIFVELVPDTGTVSGYRWSSLNGPAMTIHAGMPCEGEIILARRRPIELLLPAMAGRSGPESP